MVSKFVLDEWQKSSKKEDTADMSMYEEQLDEIGDVFTEDSRSRLEAIWREAEAGITFSMIKFLDCFLDNTRSYFVDIIDAQFIDLFFK